MKYGWLFCSNITSFNISAILPQNYQHISVGFPEVNFILRCTSWHEKFGRHFSCQPLLLSTTILNDTELACIIMCPLTVGLYAHVAGWKMRLAGCAFITIESQKGVLYVHIT